MRSIATLIIALAIVTGSATVLWAEEAAAKTQTTCPVMGGAVDKSSQYVDVEGKRIYVCCGGCVGAVKQNPEKYIKALEDDGVVLEKVPSEAGSEAGSSEHGSDSHHDH